MRACVRAHHPDHEVGEQGDPKRGCQEGEQVPALPLRQAAVGDGAVEQDAHGPREQPPNTQAPSICTHGTRAGFLAGVVTESAKLLNYSHGSQGPSLISGVSVN